MQWWSKDTNWESVTSSHRESRFSFSFGSGSSLSYQLKFKRLHNEIPHNSPAPQPCCMDPTDLTYLHPSRGASVKPWEAKLTEGRTNLKVS